MQRRAADLRSQIEGATGSEKANLMVELSGILESILKTGAVDTASEDFAILRESIVMELEALQAAATEQGNLAVSIEQQMLEVEAEMKDFLEDIDNQVKVQTDLMKEIADQAAIDLQARTDQLDTAIANANAATAQAINQAREAASARIRELAMLETEIARIAMLEQEGQKEKLVEQLGELGEMNSPQWATVVALNTANGTLSLIDRHLTSALAANALTTQNSGGTFNAAQGFHGIVTEPTRFLVGEAGRERVDIEPGGGTNLNISVSVTGGGTADEKKLSKAIVREINNQFKFGELGRTMRGN